VKNVVVAAAENIGQRVGASIPHFLSIVVEAHDRIAERPR